METPSDDWLERLADIDLERLAVSANLADSSTGRLKPVASIGRKLDAALEEAARTRRLDVVAVAIGQGELPHELLKRDDTHLLLLLKVASLPDLVNQLFEEDGRRAQVLREVRATTCSIDLIFRKFDLLSHDPNIQVFQPPPYLKELSTDDIHKIFPGPKHSHATSEITSRSRVHVDRRVADFLANSSIREAAASLREHVSIAWDENELVGDSRQETGVLSVDDLFARGPGLPLVVLGKPGGGKSTLLNYMAQCAAEGRLLSRQRRLLPVSVRLSHWDEYNRGQTQKVRKGGPAQKVRKDNSTLLPRYLHSIHPAIKASQWKRFLKRGDVLLLLDGLDEVDDPKGQFVTDILKPTIRQHYPESPAVVSCRMAAFDFYLYGAFFEGFPTYRLIGLNVGQIRTYARAYARAVGVDEGRLVSHVERLIEVRALRELAGNPLLLSVLCSVLAFRQDEAPPLAVRGQLYNEAVNLLLDRQRNLPFEFSPEVEQSRRPILERASLILFVQQPGQLSRLSLDRDNMVAAFEAAAKQLGFAESKSVGRQVLDDAIGRGLIQPRELYSRRPIYQYTHLQFHEYLAGCALAGDPDFVRQLFFHLANPRWREVILMAIGQVALATGRDDRRFHQVADELISHDDPFGHLLPRASLLLVSALPDLTRIEPHLLDRIADGLLNAYADRDRIEHFPDLARQVEEGFKLLCEADGGERLLPLILRSLGEAATDPARGMAAARLIRSTRLYSTDTVAALLKAVPEDSPDWGWPIDDALRDVVADERASPRLVELLDQAIPFRRLAEDSEAWGRLRSDPRWLRVVIALFGGFNARLVDRITEAEKSLGRLKDENQKLLSRPQEDVSKVEREGLDAAIAQAESRSKALRESRHHLRPMFFHRPSPLADRLWDDFLAETPWTDILPWLIEEVEGGIETAASRDAWLVLAVTGYKFELVLDVFANSEVLGNALTRLDAMLSQTVESAFLESLGENEFLTKVLPEFRSDLIAAVVRSAGRYPLTLGLVGPSSSQSEAGVSDFPESANMSTFSLEAEMASVFWHRILASDSEDIIYNMCVVLDTTGGRMARTSMLLAASLAVAHVGSNARSGIPNGWPLDPLAPQVGSKPSRHVVGAALDSLAAIPPRYDFVLGWALVQMAPLIREAGLTSEAVLLGYSLLTDRFGSREEALRALTREEEQIVVEGSFPLPAMQSSVGFHFPDGNDPVTVSRFVARLASLTTGRISGIAPSRLREVARSIADPAIRAWLCEQLALNLTTDQRSAFLAESWEAARQIPWDDADNRTRAIIRLSLLDPERADNVLADHLAELHTELGSFDEGRPWLRAKALATLREYVLCRPRLAEPFKKALDGLIVESDRLTARGVTSHLVMAVSEILPEPMAVLGIAAVAHDVRRALVLSEDLDGVWLALASERKVVALKRLGEQSHPDGLRLTRAAAASLAWLARDDDWETVHEVLPWLRNPDIAAGPLLAAWIAHEDATVSAYATLLTAELHGLSSELVVGLKQLLRSDNYLTRGRAALMLYGNDSSRTPRLLASRLGLETVRTIAKLMSDSYEKQIPQCGHALVLTISRIVFDRPELIRQLFEEAGAEGEEAEAARAVLRLAQVFTDSAWSEIVRLLGADATTIDVRRMLLRVVCSVAYCGLLSDQRWEGLLTVLERIDPDAFAHDYYHADQCSAVVDSAVATREHYRGRKFPDRSEVAAEARRRYFEARRSLADVLRQLIDPSPTSTATVRRELGEAGSHRFFGPDLDRRKTRAADRIEASPELLEVLVPWLVEALNEPRGNRFRKWNTFSHMDDLLTTIGEAALRVPGEFRDIVEKRFPVLRLRLYEAAQRNDYVTGRQAAYQLFSVLGRLDDAVVESYKVVLRDTVPAQAVAAETLARYREIDAAFVPQILGIVRDDPCSTTRYLAARMLVTVARNVFLDVVVRDAIINGLREILLESDLRQDVHLLTEEFDNDKSAFYSLKYVGRLDRLLYSELLALSGVYLGPRGHDASPSTPDVFQVGS